MTDSANPEAAAAKPRAIRPRDAATLIVLDASGKTPKVLMGRRHHGHVFMPGKFVFPGGRLEPGDRQMNVAGALDSRVEAKLLLRRPRATITLARALALAAIRETFEETGLVLGNDGFGAPESPPPGAWTDFAAHGCYPDLQDLHFIARAITPPVRPKRFDTRFFSVDASAIAKRLDGFVTESSELVELVWIALDEAETLDLPAITRKVLHELKLRQAAGMSRFLPVPFFYESRGKWRRDEL